MQSALFANIPDRILKDIENEFRGNQAGLEALRGAYQKVGLDTYSIDKNIYDVQTTYNELAQGVFDTFKKPCSLSAMNGAFLTLNNIESVCEPTPKEQAKIEISSIPKMF